VLLSLSVIRQPAACNEPMISLLSVALITVFPVCRFILRSLELLTLICISPAVTLPVTRDESLIIHGRFPRGQFRVQPTGVGNIQRQAVGGIKTTCGA